MLKIIIIWRIYTPKYCYAKFSNVAFDFLAKAFLENVITEHLLLNITFVLGKSLLHNSCLHFHCENVGIFYSRLGFLNQATVSGLFMTSLNVWMGGNKNKLRHYSTTILKRWTSKHTQNYISKSQGYCSIHTANPKNCFANRKRLCIYKW